SELARSAANAEESAASDAPPPASQQSTAAQQALMSLAGDRSLDAERCLALLSQAERIRLTLLALARLRIRLGRESGSGAQTAILDQTLKAASHALTAIAEWPGAMSFDGLTAVGNDAGDASDARLRTPLNEVRQIEAAANQLRGSADGLPSH